jgi:hypothetical protein
VTECTSPYNPFFVRMNWALRFGKTDPCIPEDHEKDQPIPNMPHCLKWNVAAAPRYGAEDKCCPNLCTVKATFGL